MRILLVLATTVLPYSVMVGQHVYSFNDPASEPIRAMGLDSIYRSGAHVDSTKAVFGTEQEEFFDAYQGMLQDLGKYLKAHDFIWEQPVKGFNRIYFSKEGKIDYFLYSIRPGQLTVEQEKRFDELLKGFVADYRFPMTAEVGFAQCSGVTYMPPKK
ncbi:MAG TPA: hypothetical protein VKG92_05105 [Flavobacteriales bacterium]|nr:hypothetical protein [Flavobacteriales bacterium]